MTPAIEALRRAYTEQFLLARQLREGAIPAARVDAVRGQLHLQLAAQRRTLMRADIHDQTIDDAELAVIALIDESAQLSADPGCAEKWMLSPVQYMRYGHTHLGRDFFVRLEVLRSRPDTPIALLELYLRGLIWGFEGRYREEQRPDDLRALRESLRIDVQHRLGSPPPLAAPLAAVQPPPAPAPLLPGTAVLGLAAGLVLLLGTLLTASLSWSASDTVRALRMLNPESKNAGAESGSAP